MCLYPIKIANPHYHGQPHQYIAGEVHPLSSDFVSARPTIEVPCGDCLECQNTRYSAILQRAQIEAATSYVYFVTMTYDEQHIPSFEFTTNDGKVKSVYFSDVRHTQAMFKRLRNVSYFADRGLRFLAVTEFGSERFRPHHHLLVYVARKSTDNELTPYKIESSLSFWIRRFYAKNVGTRKHPIYEPYFTYVRKFKNGHWNSTFDCRLVVDRDKKDKFAMNDPTAVTKSINYLIGYVQKTSKYDAAVGQALSQMKDYMDRDTYKHLCRMLQSRLYYSKHFGFGYYDDGSKVVPSPLYKPLTLKAALVDECMKDYPEALEDLSEEDESELHEYMNELYHLAADRFRLCCRSYSKHYLNAHYSLDKELKSRAIKRYWPDFFKALLKVGGSCSSDYYPIVLPKTFTESYKNSTAYKLVRRSVHRGLDARQPFISWTYEDKNVAKYVPLCRYYRRYCCTSEDTRRLFDSLGVHTFDEYVQHLNALHNSSAEERLKRYNIKNANHEDRCEERRQLRDNLLKSKFYNIFAPRVSVVLTLNQ